jgi:3-hydroxyacyl-CoA dehydrogenase/enoyl-CoA hydratase/3-hydroxybutyryl-CoA epimerase
MSNEIYTVDVDNDGIALVTWDMKDRSMNVFTQEALEQLDGLVDRFVADDAVKGVVFTSGKPTFSGGADLTMMKTMLAGMKEEMRTNPDNAQQMLFDQVGKMSWLYRKIETCGKPWVSAINGVCMGGAFELSLACHGRVAADSPSVKMALPEVKVGIFPGAGGTQRVPRLTNAQDALQMMTTGQSLTPSRAKAMGLIHEVVEPKKLISAAKAMIKGGLSPVAPWDVKGFKLPGGPGLVGAGRTALAGCFSHFAA